ncbi:G-PROTEIN-RECEP-F1-2 domain-containing protein [Aphelenchoides fujianensis]|nr:G-PROTEIN-RECEP-F1-2 domain-containing protein [Aphelenchoides fujianensis]KAI6224296.1 G-PROTEIN-RECEP-F1-2 domain-containing protein [Aphelenchoides fujianensis]
MRCNETEPWRPLGFLLDLWILPLTCLVGLLLNIACLFVFSNRRSHPLVPALMVLSICDSLQLLISLFVLYLPALHDHLEMDPFGSVAQLAYVATGALAGGLLTSNCASIWTMCYISIQRHRAIVKPLSTVTDAKRNTSWHLFGIFLFALFFNAPVWLEFTWSLDQVHTEDGQPTWILWHTTSALAQSPVYRLIMRQILYPIMVYVIPLFLISILNMRILSHISASRAAVKTVGYRKHIDRERRSIWLLISIVVVFFMCHTGGLVIRFIDQRKYENQSCFVFAKDFINFLFNVNSFVDPMLYFFFTKSFRDLTTNWASNNNTNSVTQRLLRRLSSRASTTTKN